MYIQHSLIHYTINPLSNYTVKLSGTKTFLCRVGSSELIPNIHFLYSQVLGTKRRRQQFLNSHLHIGTIRFGQIHIPVCAKLGENKNNTFSEI